MTIKSQPLNVIGDLVFEAGRGVDLPFRQLLLEPIVGDLAQHLRLRASEVAIRVK